MTIAEKEKEVAIIESDIKKIEAVSESSGKLSENLLPFAFIGVGGFIIYLATKKKSKKR